MCALATTQKLADSAQNVLGKLDGEALCGSFIRDHFGNGFSCIAGTLDLRSGIVVAPVSNIEPRDLLEVVQGLEVEAGQTPSQSQSVISRLRNLFGVHVDKSRPIVHVASQLAKAKRQSNRWVVLEMSCCGELSWVTKTYKPQFLSGYLRERPTVSANVYRLVNALRGQDEDGGHNSFVCVRCRTPYPDEASLRYQVPTVSICVVWSDGTSNWADLEAKVDQVSQLSCAMASSVFYERERYFLKSIRQATHGKIIKTGPHSELVRQAFQLDTLVDTDHLPRVSDRDRALANTTGRNVNDSESNELTWYEMDRLTLQTLGKLFREVDEFKQFEVEALVYSSIRLLRAHFWKGGEALEIGPISKTMAGAATYMAGSFEWCCSIFSKLQRAVENGRVTMVPTQRSLELMPQNQESLTRDLLVSLGLDREQYVVKATPDIHWYWDPGTSGRKPHLSPRVETSSVAKFLSARVREAQENSQVLGRIRVAAHVHCDPHFENVMVDPSIPEDPLVYFIDPLLRERDFFVEKMCQERKPDSPLSEGEHLFPFNGKQMRGAAKTKVDNWFRNDVTLDYAKLMVSATALYGLFYQGAFSIGYGVSDDDSSRRLVDVRISRNLELENIDLGGAGGISGQGVFAQKQGIVDSAVSYHKWSADLLLDEFVKDHAEEDGYDVVYSVRRLFLFVLRDGFSLAGNLLHRDVSSGYAMFVWCMHLFSLGREAFWGDEDVNADNVVAKARAVFSPGMYSHHLPDTGLFAPS